MASKGEKTRSEIIGCAKELFYHRGYEATSFSDIVDASGLQRGNIYHYFKTKDDILKAVIEQRQTEISAVLKYWDQQLPDARSRLAAFVAMVATNAELKEYGCPIGSLNTELGKDKHELREKARILVELFIVWLAKQFEELGYTNEARDLALHLFGRAQGIAVMTHVYDDIQVLKRETRQLDTWLRNL